MRSRRLWVFLVVIAALLAASLRLVWTTWRSAPVANTTLKQFDVILVLGTPSRPDGTPSPEQRERVLEGVREWRRGVAPRIVMSGAAAHNRWVEAHSMSLLAEQEGVPVEDIVEERQARNTIGNVFYTVRILQAHGWRSAEVVSSWSHLPRAALILERSPLLWRTDAAPWPREFNLLDRSVRDWREALYCVRIRLFGFPSSRFNSNGAP